VITASATAPGSFAEKVLDALGLADDQLRYYVAMHARQYAGMPQVRAA
jgi:hypothetical protein